MALQDLVPTILTLVLVNVQHTLDDEGGRARHAELSIASVSPRHEAESVLATLAACDVLILIIGSVSLDGARRAAQLLVRAAKARAPSRCWHGVVAVLPGTWLDRSAAEWCRESTQAKATLWRTGDVMQVSVAECVSRLCSLAPVASLLASIRGACGDASRAGGGGEEAGHGVDERLAIGGTAALCVVACLTACVADQVNVQRSAVYAALSSTDEASREAGTLLAQTMDVLTADRSLLDVVHAVVTGLPAVLRSDVACPDDQARAHWACAIVCCTQVRLRRVLLG